MKQKSFYLFVILMLFSFSAFAQYGSVGGFDARSIGMAKTYNALSNGVNAIGINPANILSGKKGQFEFSTILPLPSVSLRSGTSFLSIKDFNYYFGGVDGESRYLNDADKDRLNSLFKDGGDVFIDASANLFSIVWNVDPHIGAVGFSVSDFWGGYLKVPQAFVEIPLYGNVPEQQFSFSEASVNSWWLRDYSVSYATKILKNITAGISIKYVNGFYFVGTERVNTNFTTGSQYEITGTADMVGYASFSKNFGVNYDFDSTEYKSGFSPFPSPAGRGVGFDWGVSAELNRMLHVSLAVTDIGSINWSERVAKYTALGEIYVDDISNKDQLDSLEEKIKGKGSYTSNYTTSLPTALRFGVSVLLDDKEGGLPGTMLLGLDYNQGFNNMPGNSVKARFSVGAEWKPMDWIPYLRSGFSFGGWAGFNWAFGLGVDAGIVELNFATSDFNSVISPNSAKNISLSFGSRWKF